MQGLGHPALTVGTLSFTSPVLGHACLFTPVLCYTVSPPATSTLVMAWGETVMMKSPGAMQGLPAPLCFKVGGKGWESKKFICVCVLISAGKFLGVHRWKKFDSLCYRKFLAIFLSKYLGVRWKAEFSLSPLPPPWFKPRGV